MNNLREAEHMCAIKNASSNSLTNEELSKKHLQITDS